MVRLMVLCNVQILVITAYPNPGVGSIFYRGKRKAQTFGIKGLRFFCLQDERTSLLCQGNQLVEFSDERLHVLARRFAVEDLDVVQMPAPAGVVDAGQFADHRAVEGHAGENALGDRVAEDRRVGVDVGADVGVASARSGHGGDVGAQREGAAAERLHALFIVDGQNQRRRRSADLQSDRPAADAEKRRPVPLARLGIMTQHQALAVSAADDEPRLDDAGENGHADAFLDRLGQSGRRLGADHFLHGRLRFLHPRRDVIIFGLHGRTARNRQEQNCTEKFFHVTPPFSKMLLFYHRPRKKSPTLV